MERWFSGAVIDAVREAKSRRALFIVYIQDESEQSQSMNEIWTHVWANLDESSKMVALRLSKDTEACKQFQAIYKIEKYPTVYFINGQNGKVLEKLDDAIEDATVLLQRIDTAMKIVEPIHEPVAIATTVVEQPIVPDQEVTKTVEQKKSVEFKVAEARARLKELNDKREIEAKEKEKNDELERRQLGQQMQLDKQKKTEELLRKQAEEVRREKLEQKKLEEKIKAQIQQDREDKRRKYEAEKSSRTESASPKITTAEVEKPKVNYTRARLQFRLTDGSFFTEDFPVDARMNDVYAYLQEALPRDQYRNGSYVLRTIHTRVALTRDNTQTLSELELVPSAVLLVLKSGNVVAEPSNRSVAGVFQTFQFIFTWFMMQFNFVYQLIARRLFGQPTATPPQERATPPVRRNIPGEHSTPKKRENFNTDSTEKSTFRRFHNTQDDSDDEEKRTWNGNSTQQM